MSNVPWTHKTFSRKGDNRSYEGKYRYIVRAKGRHMPEAAKYAVNMREVKDQTSWYKQVGYTTVWHEVNKGQKL